MIGAHGKNPERRQRYESMAKSQSADSYLRIFDKISLSFADWFFMRNLTKKTLLMVDAGYRIINHLVWGCLNNLSMVKLRCFMVQ